MTKIKCCGLRRDCDIDYANILLPEYIGFIFAKGRRRYIAPEKALKLRQRLKSGIAPVGVFVNEDIGTVADIVKMGAIDIIQLHGQEDDDYIAALRARVDKPIIKAYPISCEQDMANAERSTADFILLDNGAGGTGSAFDWSLLQCVKRPYFLAGGISPDNVADALAQHPFALDVSSGIETEGYKDFEKMQKLIRAVRENSI